MVHTDLARPIDPVSRDGHRYALSFTDDYSSAVFVYFLKNKSDTVTSTENSLLTWLHMERLSALGLTMVQSSQEESTKHY